MPLSLLPQYGQNSTSHKQEKNSYKITFEDISSLGPSRSTRQHIAVSAGRISQKTNYWGNRKIRRYYKRFNFCFGSIFYILWMFNKTLLFFFFGLFQKEFSLDLVIWQQWEDPRLNHALNYTLTLPADSKKLIWLPDTFFLNVRSANIHDVISENGKVSINPRGQVSYSARCV